MKNEAKYALTALSAAAILLCSSVVAVAAPEPTAAPAVSTVKLTATVNPNPPRAGDNTLDLQLTDASGQPMSGVKLSARVEMTSMDMGTSHPTVKDIGNGHYRATATFSMAGPWRVTVSAGKNKAALDFDAGGKSGWKSPSLVLALPTTSTPSVTASPASTSPTMQGMAGMDMSTSSSGNSATRPSTAQAEGMVGPGFGPNGPPGTASSDNMAGMDMSSGDMSGMKMDSSDGATMDMKPLKMPQLQEQGTYVASGNENWKVRTGFGKNTGMVAMMSQMMVGGSGMEGMKMPAMKMSFDDQNFTQDPDDTDASTATNGGNVSGMSGMSTATTAAPSGNMAGMTMGDSGGARTDGVPSKSDSTASSTTAGKPTGSSADSMPGIHMPSSGSVPSNAPVALTITGSITSPKSGDNTFSVMVTDAAGTPITGAKITTTVAMTTMDMGTTHPPLKEVGGGRYQGTVNFGMSGPWRVVVKVTAPGGGLPQKKTFDFNAK